MIRVTFFFADQNVAICSLQRPYEFVLFVYRIIPHVYIGSKITANFQLCVLFPSPIDGL